MRGLAVGGTEPLLRVAYSVQRQAVTNHELRAAHGVNVRIASTILAGVCLALPLACGTSPPSGSSSGPPVDPSKTLAELSSSEMGTFCDWVAQQEGGYGATISCHAGTGTGSLEAPQDQTTCVTELSQHASEPNCSATVGQWATCVDWLDANWCTTTPSMMPAECAVLQATCYASGGAPADGGGD
jgi:hypothetical protein